MPIRPTFYAFEMARTAMSASQKNIDITGQNIANIDTPGYSRQRVNLSSVGPGGRNWRYTLHPGELVGLGVNVDSIRRVRDQFLDGRYRTELSDNSRFAAKLDILGYVEGNIDEFIGDEGTFSAIVSDFEKALQNLNTGGTDEIEFMNLAKNSAEKLVYTSRTISDRLNLIKQDTINQLDFTADEVNRIAKALADVNISIRNEFLLGGVSNELLDERDLLLDQLSQFGDVTSRPAISTINGKEVDTGAVHVYFGKFDSDAYDYADNPPDATMNPLLVSGTSSIGTDLDGKPVYNRTLAFDTANPGDPVRLTWVDGDGIPLAEDFIPTSGEIFAYYEMLNGTGDVTATGEDIDIASKGIPYFMNMIDTFVSEFAEVFNELNGGVGFELFVANDGGNINAGNITISDAWQKDPTLILTTLDQSGTPGASRNDNIMRMIHALKDETREFTDVNGVIYKGNFQQYLGTINSEIGLEINFNNNKKSVSDINLLTVDTYRASIMDVSEDEEAMNLMKYQKSYNAAIRFMTVLDEMLDQVVNRLGIAGR